ncbi:MAG: hypothetical protein FJY95_16675 [Candidatus Handelsmanbacteria bacterium]|nr:hypothetical protein [Candidatus Handelsmanbacteria bacterium]
MLGFVLGPKKEAETFDPPEAAGRLAELNPTLAQVLLQTGPAGQVEDLGRAYFLRRGRQLYRDRDAF